MRLCYIQQKWVTDVLGGLKEKVSTSLLLRRGSEEGTVTSGRKKVDSRQGVSRGWNLKPEVVT